MADFNSSLYTLIGDKIKKLRVARGINQETLSKNLGIGRTSISNIELGRHQAPLHLIFRICSELQAEIHSVIPTVAEINESLTPTDVDLLAELQRQNLSGNSIKEIASYIQAL